MPTGSPGFLWRISQADALDTLPNSLQRVPRSNWPGSSSATTANRCPTRRPKRRGRGAWTGRPRRSLLGAPRLPIASVINLNEWGGRGRWRLCPGRPDAGHPGRGSSASHGEHRGGILTLVELPARRGHHGREQRRRLSARPWVTRGSLRGRWSWGSSTVRAASGGRALCPSSSRSRAFIPSARSGKKAVRAASLEWFTVQPDGTRVLVNDVANGGLPCLAAGVPAADAGNESCSPRGA